MSGYPKQGEASLVIVSRAARARWIWCGTAGLLLLAGCQQIIGLDERTVEEQAATRDSDAGLPPTACETYCDDAISACSSENPAFVSGVDGSDMDTYGSKRICLAVCSHFDKSADPDGDQNTLVCRKESAALANEVPNSELPFYCSAAGPGGGAPRSDRNCGTNCQGYCALYGAVCDPNLDIAECERQCGGLRDNQVVNADKDFMTAPDSVQCRLAHVSVAATIEVDRDAHCDHARLVPHEDDSFGCDLAPDTAPNCDDYCKLVNVACKDELAVYQGRDQCLAVCRELPAGLAKELTGNSVACRRWRAYAALVDPKPHCGNAGPASAGPCGDPCEPYCKLAQKSCGADFTSTFATEAACKTACRAVPFSGAYLVAKAKGNTLECRLLAAAKAAAGDANACPSVFGRGECQ